MVASGSANSIVFTFVFPPRSKSQLGIVSETPSDQDGHDTTLDRVWHRTRTSYNCARLGALAETDSNARPPDDSPSPLCCVAFQSTPLRTDARLRLKQANQDFRSPDTKIKVRRLDIATPADPHLMLERNHTPARERDETEGTDDITKLRGDI